MYYNDHINQLCLITILCTSFFIVVFTFLMNKDKSVLRLMGCSLFITFILNSATFITTKEAFIVSIKTASTLILTVSICMLLFIKPKVKYHRIIILIIAVIPFITYFVLTKFHFAYKLVTNDFFMTFLIAVFALLAMYSLRKEKDSKSLLFWSILSILLSFVAEKLDSSDAFKYASLFLTIAGYITLVSYFYKETVKKLLKKVAEAEKQLHAVNKSLDLEVKKRVFEIELSNERLLNISKSDSLTKAFNKAGIMEKIEKQMNAKSTTGFCILMFDIDSFKTINDTMGHVTGDKCLKKLALIAKSSIRDVDSLGRYGGDEFIVLLPESTVSQAQAIAERFRKNVEKSESPHFTVSIGIAHYPSDGATVKELISAADVGLYQSKRKGKNAVSYKNVF